MNMLSDTIMQYLPTILFMVAGFSLIVVEAFIPGFGLPGISGIILLIAGIVVGANSFVEALVMIIVVVVLLSVILWVSIHALSKGRFSRSKFVLKEVSYDGINENDMGLFEGKTGVSKTVLRPAGIGEFEGRKLNVVSDGEFIAKDEKIEVIRVEGNRIVVGRVEIL